MLVVMKEDLSEQELEGVMQKLTQFGLSGHMSRGVERTVIGVVGQTYPELRDTLELLPGVEEVIPISKPYKLSSREFQPENTTIKVGDVIFGGDELVIIAGPCAVETEKQILETANAVKAAGANILRGGAFKPAPPHISFAVWVSKGWRCWLWRVSKQAYHSSPRFSPPRMLNSWQGTPTSSK